MVRIDIIVALWEGRLLLQFLPHILQQVAQKWRSEARIIFRRHKLCAVKSMRRQSNRREQALLLPTSTVVVGGKAFMAMKKQDNDVNIVLSFPRHQNAECKASETPCKGAHQSKLMVSSTPRQYHAAYELAMSSSGWGCP